MSAVAAAGRRYLPRGWGDLGLQLAIWFGFLAAYQVARGMANRDPSEAFSNGLKIVRFERDVSSKLVELSLQQFVSTKDWLAPVVSWTYWNSEFTVLGLALLWVYLWRHASFTRFRNTILLANVLGLVGYVLVPTAPPRMFPGFGFSDTLGSIGGVNHGSGLVQLAANPYAAMPSLHAADALILGATLAYLCRRRVWKIVWAVWPLWVWFSVMATANHFGLDVIAGVAVAVLALAIIHRTRLKQLILE